MSRFILIALILSPTLVYGQVSTINALPDITSKYGWSSDVAASGSYRKDNNYDDSFVLSTISSSLYKERFWSIYGLAKGTYRTDNGQTKELSAVEHIRARINLAGFDSREVNYEHCADTDDCENYPLSDRLILESFVQHEFDPFRKLDARFLFGVGPAIHLLHSKLYDFVVGTAYTIEYLDFTTSSKELNHRWSSYLQSKLKINDSLELNAITFAQFKLDNFLDFLWMGSVATTTKITKRVDIQFSITFNYDSRPPRGVKRFSNQTNSTLIMKF